MNPNLFWCIIGIIGGAVFSFIISAFFYFISKNKKKLYYNVDTKCIISNKISNIENLKTYYHNNIEINDLYHTVITFENNGKLIIEEKDFSKRHPLCVITDGIFISPEKNDILLPIYEDAEEQICKKIIIKFEYIPKHNVLNCSFIHTSTISVDYTPKEVNVKEIDYAKQYNKYVIIFLIFICIIVCTSFPIFVSHVSKELSKETEKNIHDIMKEYPNLK